MALSFQTFLTLRRFEPYIDAETMTLHHDKHHATYVAMLMLLLKNTQKLVKTLANLWLTWNKFQQISSTY